jgi:uncharacterized protein YbcC (UPF0753/DUF2309 family)
VVVKDTVRPDNGPDDRGTPEPLRDRLTSAVRHASHLLPAQGPITVFIHHNTLHAFEHLPFDRAVCRGAEVFGCQPYLPEERYRQALARGRIRFDDLLAILEHELGFGAVESVARLATRIDLRLAMLQYALPTGSAEELRWFLEETDALRKVRPEASATARGKMIAETRRWVMRDLRGRNDANPAWVRELFARFGADAIEGWDDSAWEAFALEALWRVCREGVGAVPEWPSEPTPPVRHRDLLLRVAGIDTDLWVHEVLIRFTAAFLDQGLSHWPLPEREQGFFRAFCSLYSRGGGPPDRWLGGLAGKAARLLESGATAADCACESLAALGVPPREWDDYLSATLLPLRGWGGMVHQIETRGDRVAQPIPEGSLVGFVAVRLLLDRLAVAHASRAIDCTRPLPELRDELQSRLPALRPRGEEERAFPVFQLAQLLGWSPATLAALGPDGWGELVREIEAFPEVERRRVFHLAYERRFRDQCLDALVLHAPHKPRAPRFQVVTCLDEREESFRRHLEEVEPACETFGAAGFFGVAMYYRGAADAHHVPLCPVVIRPNHYVEEYVEEEREDDGRARRLRRTVGRTAHWVHVATRTFALGAVLSAGIGVLASIPLVGRVMFPGLAARLRRRAGQFLRTPKQSRLRLERTEATPGPECGRVGFTLAEMTDIAERVLRDSGLTRDFCRLVIVLGHGSHSMNNPHESAHDCGACGGSVGGPNGRAIAQILNDPRVRAGLATRGVVIPADTVFVGGVHNTCNEYVKFFDLDRVPASHRDLFEASEGVIEEALDRNSHERARRFESAPLTITPAGARQHMDDRAEDLAQVRPEWGHATNAWCVVGRRERTRGLFLDRRAFLTSYDPTQDDANGTILARTMAAIFPVCGGISLEYYFSHVDNPGYGCGTKLPHNITSLLGVMDGAASDLRTGLPWQMVEIHEPVRLLIVCETTPEVMRKVLHGNPAGKALCDNGWVQLAVLTPHANEILLYQKGEFLPYSPTAERLPVAGSSVDWYRGWRDHLELAEIAPCGPSARGSDA